jgi:guanyl-specific ribonuclease Sa
MNGALQRQLYRLAIFAVVFALVWIAERYGLIDGKHPARPPIAKPPVAHVPQTESKPAAPPQKVAKPSESTTASASKPTASDPLVVRNVALRDQDGRTIYQGDVDLHSTLERIAAGKQLRFSHDGTTFQNREGRLPRQAPGYYREWVVPTPGEDGPGPQRLVTGDDGDVWYTHDHYRSFRRIPTKLETR